MFEKVVLRQSDTGGSLTVGELAEALLFYQNVHLMLDHGSLSHLISQIGMPHLLKLLSRPNVSAVFCDESLGTKTDKIGDQLFHNFIAFTLAGSQETGVIKNRKKRIEFILGRQGYERKIAKKLSERFCLKVPTRKLSGDYFVIGGVVNAANSEMNDRDFIYESMRRVVSNIIGENIISADFKFNVVGAQSNFQIDTNLNFDLVTAAKKKRARSFDGEITPAYLINHVLGSCADTVFASHYGGEFYTSDLSSQIIQLKHSELLKRMGIERNELREFKEIVVTDVPSIREVLNSGERTFDEFLSVLEKSQKFREFTQGVNPDEKLVEEYWKSVTAEGWISRSPSKVLRYVLGSVHTALEPVSGSIGSAVDSLFIEKLLGGWKPNHFVEK